MRPTQGKAKMMTTLATNLERGSEESQMQSEAAHVQLNSNDDSKEQRSDQDGE